LPPDPLPGGTLKSDFPECEVGLVDHVRTCASDVAVGPQIGGRSERVLPNCVVGGVDDAVAVVVAPTLQE
jgi:hypothetical protein